VGDIQYETHSKFLAVRSIKRLISSELFKDVFKSVSKEKQIEVEQYIKNNDVIKLKKWIKNNRTIELGTMSIRQLKDRAKELGVRNYSMMTKSMLLSEITREISLAS
jgi:hypothetical protein